MLRDRKGFSLLEAIVALFIVGIAAISALEAVGQQLRAHAVVQRQLEAEALAEYRMSLIQLLFHEEFTSFPDSLSRGRFDEPFERYSWDTRVEQHYDERENLFSVDLTVSWDGGSYSLNNMLYRRPQTLSTGQQQGTPQPPGRQGGPP